MESVGETLRLLRVAKNWSQAYIAQKLDIDYTTYSRYESGETAPKYESIVAVCNLYNLSLDEFQHYGEPGFKVGEPKMEYQKRWSVPITVALDGTTETLEMWLKKLTAINAAL